MMKILIIEDHPIVRKGVRQVITEAFSKAVVHEANAEEEAFSRLRENNYSLVLLDLGLPGNTGMDVLKKIKREKPKLAVLVLSMYPEEQYAVRVLKAGASGYIGKENLSSELLEAIQKVLQGKKYISSTLAEILAYDLNRNSKEHLHQTLSDREMQILCMIASGKTVTGIAEKLFLSTKTVSTYRSRVMEKMRMKNNAQLTHYAIKNRLVM